MSCCLTCVLKNEPGSFGKAVCALHLRPISHSPSLLNSFHLLSSWENCCLDYSVFTSKTALILEIILTISDGGKMKNFKKYIYLPDHGLVSPERWFLLNFDNMLLEKRPLSHWGWGGVTWDNSVKTEQIMWWKCLRKETDWIGTSYSSPPPTSTKLKLYYFWKWIKIIQMVMCVDLGGFMRKN